MLVLPRRSAKTRLRRQKKNQGGGRYVLCIFGLTVLPLTSSPVPHAYEPVPCIVSFLWPMHVSHLQYHPEHTYSIHAPNHRTCKKKHRLETDYFHKLAMLIPSRRICCVGESHLLGVSPSRSTPLYLLRSFVFASDRLILLAVVVFHFP